jgi:hypothetical protein
VAAIQVILQGARSATYDIRDFPLVLQFGDQTSYEAAVYYIPAFSLRIPARYLSEIRTLQGAFSVLVDGPEGFRSGPHPTTWVRSYYPRGKDCALIVVDSDYKKLNGVALSVVEGSLIVDQLGGPTCV